MRSQSFHSSPFTITKGGRVANNRRRGRGDEGRVRLRDCIVCDQAIYKGDPASFGRNGNILGLRHDTCEDIT